jgi:hypothetical protein
VAFVTPKKCAYLLTVFSFGVLTLIGCGRSQRGTAPQSEAQRAREAYQRALEAKLKQLELKIGVAKTEWRQNEPIVVSVYLINNGRGHVIVTENIGWRDYQISVVDGDDRPVPRRDISMQEKLNRGAYSARPRAIEPGETLEDRIPLSEDFMMNWKGFYKVTVQRWVGFPWIVERELISNTITISVVE